MYKIQDKVKIISTNKRSTLYKSTIGEIGTIVEINTSTFKEYCTTVVKVSFEKFKNTRTKDGYFIYNISEVVPNDQQSMKNYLIDEIKSKVMFHKTQLTILTDLFNLICTTEIIDDFTFRILRYNLELENYTNLNAILNNLDK